MKKLATKNSVDSYDFNDFFSRSNVGSSESWISGWENIAGSITTTGNSNVYYPGSSTTTSIPYTGGTIRSGYVDTACFSRRKIDSLVKGTIIDEIEKLGFTRVESEYSMVDMRIIEVFKHITINLSGYRLFFKSIESRWLSDFMLCINYCDTECQICVSDNFVDIQKEDLIEDVKNIIKENDPSLSQYVG